MIAEERKQNIVTDDELQEIAGLYKKLNPANRELMTMASGLLLMSQKINEPEQKAG